MGVEMSKPQIQSAWEQTYRQLTAQEVADRVAACADSNTVVPLAPVKEKPVRKQADLTLVPEHLF